MLQKKTNNKIKSFDGVVRKQSVEKIPVVSKSVIKKDLIYSGLKMAGVSFIALFLSFGLSRIGSTVSYFFDSEESIGNRLQAGTLSFSLSSSNDVVGRLSAPSQEGSAVPVTENEDNIGSEQFGVTISENDGSLPIAYTVLGKLDEGSPAGCEEISLIAGIGAYHYEGLLHVFVSPKMTDLGEWQFMVALPVSSTLPADVVCSGSIVFHAGLSGVSDDLTNTYNDVKVYTFKLRNWESVVVPSAVSVDVPAEEVALPPAPEEALAPVDAGVVVPPAPSVDSSVETVEEVPAPQVEEVVVPVPESPVV